MQRAKRFRILGVLAICGVAHGVLLLLLAVKTPALSAKPFADRPGATITLLPDLVLPRPETVRRSPVKRAMTSPLQTPPAPDSSAPTATALTDLVEPVFLPGRRPGWRGRLKGMGLGTGCDDPDGIHFTAEQKEKCRTRWAGTSRVGLALAPLIDKGKLSDFERRIWCRDKYELAGVPNGSEYSNAGDITGLGYVPSFKECPAADR